MGKSTLQNWIDRIDSNTQLVVSSFGHLDGDALNKKYAQDVWSIAQNLDHIIRINSSYEPIIAVVKSGKLRLPQIARFPPYVRWMGKMILNSVDPQRHTKMKTFLIWQPSQSHISADIVMIFSAHQDQLKQWIVAVQDFVDKDVVIHSPVNRFVVYSLATAIEIIISHELRHIYQAQELQSI